ncbi:choice-of-anchor L domain-containing protein [Winogradskyella haliclonae]|uniref:PKD domain-containing protein n=1 Tax=Winogradskyella haliclonae TaxID=2048558 RepID=A0ABQ2BVR4_9FLAO|nr:choice-of-anchor L domain-containing protein [Winogradskyella haliclonae]GGI56586.1 hypothetical protein GCM10011444_08950 [Winogradskyella haliclonae]
MNKFYLKYVVKYIVFTALLLISLTSSAQDLIMQDGTFSRCAPDRFFDSGGESGNYSSNENFTITICPQTAGEVVILDFSTFSTQVGVDIMTIYDGDSTASTVIGNFSGTVSPGRVVSSDSSGCLTISFSTNGFGNTLGWEATIECAEQCQTITTSIDSTVPAINIVTNQIEILPTETVSFVGSALFSNTGANATYLWDFGTGGTATTLNTSHQFNTSGTYNVTFTVSDDNPLGCSETVTVVVFVADSIVTINNAAFPESFFLPNELIENVLVTGGCSAVDNFQSQVFGGPADLTTKSYGYFTRGGTDFPFESGIVIGSGFVSTGGNTITNAGGETGATTGTTANDVDLETALGITNTQDATFIKFNFTPTTDNLSFRYLMASEEYDGGTECQFADGFAFLLREVGTTTYTNLAVLPNGTPVNVTNINNSGGCAANTGFFAGYNIGDTNFGGRTDVLTATATVIPNTTYEIKLVVADQGDNQWDTSIFIEAGSFNLGGDLGEDITLANGTAPCGVLEDVTLDTQAPDATHTWFFNGVPIAGAGTGSTLTVTEAGTYSVDVEFAPGCSTSDSIIVEFRNSPELIAPAIDLSGCSATGTAEFNLEQNTPIVFGAQDDTEFEITYHTSPADQASGNNPITTNINNYPATDGEIIYIRIDDIATGNCAVTDDFILNVFASVTAEDVTYQLCDNADDGDDTNGEVEFNLPTIDIQVLGTQDPTQFTVSYHISPTDADMGLNSLSALYTNTTANMQNIYARVQNNNNIDCYNTSIITLQVDEVPIANTVPNQLICDDNNDGFWDFDLNALRATVLGTQDAMQFEVSFHLEEIEAIISSTTNPLPDTFTNLVAYDEDTIWVRIQNVNNTDCYVTSSFIIDVFDQPTATTYTYQLCDDNADGDDTNGFVDFSLTPADIDSFILNGQDPMQFTVTYHLNQIDADNDQGAITNIYTDDRQIIARVENNENPDDCYETVEVNLQVNALPVITDMVELLQCDNDTDGISDFNLTESEVLISTNFANETFTYHMNATDAANGASAIINPTVYTNTDSSSNPDILFVRVENDDFCFRVAQLDLFVSATQIPANIEILYEECDVVDGIDADITNGITTFDFSDAEAQIRAQAALPVGQNLTFTYYETETDALAEVNAIPDISNHRNDASPFEQEIYVRVDSDVDNACVGLGIHVRLRTINPTPRTDTESVDIIRCDDVTIGNLSEEFDLTQNEAFIFDGIPNLTATYFLDFNDALNNVTANEITTPGSYNNSNPTETIYVRVLDTSTGCFAIVDFDITVNPLPVITANISPIEECENNTDGFFTFNLTQRRDEILNGQDPTLFNVTYHTTQLGADNSDLTEIPDPSAFVNTVMDSQEIFYAITNISTPNDVLCSNTGSFFVEVLEGAQANSDGEPLDFELCDDNIIGDGVAQFDFSLIRDEVLDGQDPADYTITYHLSENAAINYNPLTDTDQLPNLYENIMGMNPQTVWVRVSNNISPNICFDVEPVTLIVNPLPIFDLDDEYILCLSSNNEAVVDVPLVLDTGLSDANHSFEWSLDGNLLPGQTSSSLTPTQGGIYEVVVTDISTSTITMCAFSDATEVIESGIPDTFDVEVTSQAFTGNNMIIATATGNSTYEYSLDNGPWELVGEFEDVNGGNHVVAARDILGCGIVYRNVTVIDFPKFFTPNGDGNNDTWNIEGIVTQPSAKIYIFDRYGKLLKQLSPTNPGWDGTYQGNNMPSDDYWFRLEYIEPTNNEMRTFSSHFSLKR